MTNKTVVIAATTILMSLSVIIGCGGGGDSSVPSDNPPNVAGVYSCTNGCTGQCTFDNELTVVQSGANVILRSANFSDASGTINNDGAFSTASDNCTCSGQFVSGTGLAHCTCGTTTCQGVTFVEN